MHPAPTALSSLDRDAVALRPAVTLEVNASLLEDLTAVVISTRYCHPTPRQHATATSALTA